MLRRRPAPVISRAGATLFGLLIALAAGILVVPVLPGADHLSAGDIAPRTLEARKSAQYVSQANAALLREEARDQVPDVYKMDLSVLEDRTAVLVELFDQLHLARQRTDLDVQAKLDLLDDRQPAASLPVAALESAVQLDRPTFEATRETVTAGLSDVLATSVTEEQIPTRIEDFITATGLTGGDQRTLVRGALNFLARPNVVIDEIETERRRANAAANVTLPTITWSEGQVIVREGEILGLDDIEALEQTGAIDNTIDNLADIGAGTVASLGLGLLLAMFLYQLQPASGAAVRRLVLTGGAFVAAMVAMRFSMPALLPDTDGHFFVFALPVAAAAMIAASLLELHFAAIVAVALGFFSAFAAATTPELAGSGFLGPLQSFELAMVFTISGLVGAATVYRADRFSRYAVSAVAVAAATWLVLIIFWLLGDDRTSESLAWLTAAAIANGLGSAVITVGVFVILSVLLGITTRIQLMELAQADHPLLARLQEEAPGTFHHSMMVGTLAERAASRIGADSLVTRVGAYYHDIGKIAQPHFYVENMIDGHGSPHDALPAHESAARIMEHVTNGLDIARKHGLPQVVRDFIPQHHGTRLVTYFYRRAVAAGDESPDPVVFRYAGPRPQSKETAIVMLADSCEAVVRAAEDRARLEDLVDGVFAERLAEGQLDECDITMRDLQDVAASFKATLRAVYHPRIPYPAPSPEELAALARPELPEPPVVPSRGG